MIKTNERGILAPLKEMESYNNILKAKAENISPLLLTGVGDSQKSHIISGLRKENGSPILVITYSELRAKEIIGDLEGFMPDEDIAFYPSKDLIFYSADVKNAKITNERFTILDQILKNENPIIVLSIEALIDRLSPKEVFKDSIFTLNVGDEISMDELSKKLVYLGYERRDLVEGYGQFSIRGGVFDIYTSIYDNAIRLEFFGDEIDGIRILDSKSQRSIENTDNISIYPMRELVYNEEILNKAIIKIEKDYEKSLKNFSDKGLYEEASELKYSVGEVIYRLKEFKNSSGSERFINYFYEDSIGLIDYLPENSQIFFDEPQRIAEHMETVLYEYGESIKNRIEKGYLLPNQAHMIMSYGEILNKTKKHFEYLMCSLTVTIRDFKIKEIIGFNVKSTGTYQNRIDLLVEDIKYYQLNNYRILLLCGNRSRGDKLKEELEEFGINSNYYNDINNIEFEKNMVILSRGGISRGFEYTDIRMAVLSDKELFTQRKKRQRQRKFKQGKEIETVQDLKLGDYIVHINHGIGIYSGIESIISGNVKRDYIKLVYSDNGVLYIPTNQMDMIQKYIGGDAAKPRINKLGGTAWQRTKLRAKGAVEILAKDLLELYAVRENTEGYVFSKDSSWQTEFEEDFPFYETEDQLRAIEDVKRDMESSKTMDRLICGDVGYGKTEIALRGAFKAVQDSKQVAYLVPTTILAQQHYNTFKERMAGYPVNIEMMSRFRTKREINKTIKNLKAGITDIVIGTHRILSDDIKFKDLGLIVVDEEQRFGVTHKEKLKKMKENVDVLTLTATPIPRTLHMSLTGIKDMSVLDEPPEERKPIQTYVMEYNEEFIKDAIHREMARGGQVYYVFNRVQNIDVITNRIQKLVPEASIAFAHGQMTERELESIMLDFIDGNIDVLVCTTIIETGLDIPNVNTIIIHDSDRMGLSQLYQLRGRVGRSSRLAYCYLMYQKNKVLDEKAERRLQAIKDFTEFGSGFKIAMRDLEIRGAGNLLGAQQHGHMDAIGYDLYTKLLAEAVAKLKGEPVKERFETSIDINISAYIPEDYIKNMEQKLEMYKRIAQIENLEDYYDVQEELEDRFGDIPQVAQNLLDIALVKGYANNIGIININQRVNNIILLFKTDAEVNPEKLTNLMENTDKLKLTLGQSPYITYINKDDISEKHLKDLISLLAKLQ